MQTKQSRQSPQMTARGAQQQGAWATRHQWPGLLSQVLAWLWDPIMKAKWALAFQLL